ncbi:SUKH-4 family immunity protein [Specibacter sp. RAF43]|uniref:SUKH-4 family immunity protein n=1 Tax=Specibacter sp. RAF43 TaxID=3233057 RepID=UPI003F9C363A
MNDSKIWAALEPMYPSALEDIPLDGAWLKPPFSNDPSGRAVICNDGDFQFVVVDRKKGAVLFVCEDDESVIASSLEQFVRIVSAWESIDRDTVGPEDDDDFATVRKTFETLLKEIDPLAAGPNEFWSLYTEELTSEDYVDVDDLDEDDDELETDTGDNDRPGLSEPGSASGSDSDNFDDSDDSDDDIDDDSEDDADSEDFDDNPDELEDLDDYSGKAAREIRVDS